MSKTWVVEITVDQIWIDDGFDLTQFRAENMVASVLPCALDDEVKVTVRKKRSTK